MPTKSRKTRASRRRQTRRYAIHRRMRGSGLPTRQSNLALTRKQAVSMQDAQVLRSDPDLWEQILRLEDQARYALEQAGITSYDDKDPIGEYRRLILEQRD